MDNSVLGEITVVRMRSHNGHRRVGLKFSMMLSYDDIRVFKTYIGMFGIENITTTGLKQEVDMMVEFKRGTLVAEADDSIELLIARATKNIVTAARQRNYVTAVFSEMSESDMMARDS